MGLKSFFLALAPALLAAQSSGVLSVGPVAKAVGKRGGSFEAKVPFVLQPGYHTNSNTPSESYLIPLKLTWEKGVAEAVEVVYPKAHMEKYSFSEKPLSVFTGNFEVTTKFNTAANAPDGPNVISGKLRYQACNDNACLPPKTLDVKLPVVIQ